MSLVILPFIICGYAGSNILIREYPQLMTPHQTNVIKMYRVFAIIMMFCYCLILFLVPIAYRYDGYESSLNFFVGSTFIVSLIFPCVYLNYAGLSLFLDVAQKINTIRPKNKSLILFALSSNLVFIILFGFSLFLFFLWNCFLAPLIFVPMGFPGAAMRFGFPFFNPACSIAGEILGGLLNIIGTLASSR